MKPTKPKNPFMSGIGTITKNMATKVMKQDELTGKLFSYAQKKVPKIDLENFSDFSTKLAQTMKNFSTISERIFQDLKQIQMNEQATESVLNKTAQLELYQKFFKQKRIVVDEFLYMYFLEKAFGETEEIDAEQVLIDYLNEQIKGNRLKFGEMLSDEQVCIFLASVQDTLKSANWIAASHLLHTYIDLLSQQLFREFTDADKLRLESYLGEKPKAQFAKKDRLILTNNLKHVEKYQENVSNEEAEIILPLVFLQIACSIYDSFPSRISRNSLVHFNSNVAFNEIDQLYVYKHIQIIKVLEQQLPLEKDYIFTTLEKIHS